MGYLNEKKIQEMGCFLELKARVSHMRKQSVNTTRKFMAVLSSTILNALY